MPDERVQAAIDNWAPRMVTQGIDYNDFVRTTARIERWQEWLDAWSETARMHLELAREAEDERRRLTAGEAFVRAALCFHFAKYVWVVDPERNREATLRARDALYEAHRLLDPSAERITAPLDGAALAANLRRPPGAERPPLVILVPGLDSTKEEFFNFERVFLDRGLATLSLDGPGQGETGFELPIRHDYEVAVAAALDAMAGRDDVDLGRVGAAGVSLGGYYAPRAAAFEHRLRAVAGVSGPRNFGELWDELPMLTRESFVHYSRSPDLEAARGRAMDLDLAGVAERISQPLLVVAGKLDRLIPWQSTEAVADEAPNATFVLYEEGNHVCNNVAYRYRPLLADWLAEELG
jgi:dipeptidyl aminopeptidase/acylaminoacyl peptidase